MGCMKRFFNPIGLLALLALFGLASVAQGDKAVTYQVNPQHNASILTGTMAPALTPAWSVKLGGSISYPIIAQGKVFVTVADTNGYGDMLYALDATTGTSAWGPLSLAGTYYWANAAYDSGVLFVVNYNGFIWAFDASSGTQLWSVQLTGQYSFSSPPTASNGVLYVGGAGSGGTVYAVSEASGAVLWTSSVENGYNSSPAVSGNAVYVSYAGPQSYALSASTGTDIWHYDSG